MPYLPLHQESTRYWWMEHRATMLAAIRRLAREGNGPKEIAYKLTVGYHHSITEKSVARVARQHRITLSDGPRRYFILNPPQRTRVEEELTAAKAALREQCRLARAERVDAAPYKPPDHLVDEWLDLGSEQKRKPNGSKK